MMINVLGSFAMGLIAEYFALRRGLPQHWRLFLTTGILGGFTTFSAFSLEAALLYERGQIGGAAIYVVRLGRARNRCALCRTGDCPYAGLTHPANNGETLRWIWE